MSEAGESQNTSQPESALKGPRFSVESIKGGVGFLKQVTEKFGKPTEKDSSTDSGMHATWEEGKLQPEQPTTESPSK